MLNDLAEGIWRDGVGVTPGPGEALPCTWQGHVEGTRGAQSPGSPGDLRQDPPPSSWGGASTPAPHFCDSGGAAILPRVPSQPQVAGPVASPFREKCACRAAGILALSPSRGILPEEADQAAFHPAGSELGSPQVRAFSPSFWLEPGC